ncbi:MAG: hypothetical protein KGL39_31735 [Patescibacteria group bacterium]|nr:hypothetical protein [Patescibacteria group bacterium]
MAKRVAARKTAARKRGRPVDPASLRQRGTMVRVRIEPELLSRAQAKAGDVGLSAVIRELLAAWCG